MKNPHGFTYQDIIYSLLAIGAVTLAIVLAMNPLRILAGFYDEQRADDVRDLMEVVLQMKYQDPEAFAQVVSPAAVGRTMIGTAQNCTGSYGSRCSDELLSDHCINLADYAVPGLINAVPVDPVGNFTEAKTGYYISFESGELEIGACNPATENEITLKKKF